MRRSARPIVGYRCRWTHPISGDVFLGELWDSRSDAIAIKAMLERYGMREVAVVPCGAPSSEGTGS